MPAISLVITSGPLMIERLTLVPVRFSQSAIESMMALFSCS